MWPLARQARGMGKGPSGPLHSRPWPRGGALACEGQAASRPSCPQHPTILQVRSRGAFDLAQELPSPTKTLPMPAMPAFCSCKCCCGQEPFAQLGEVRTKDSQRASPGPLPDQDPPQVCPDAGVSPSTSPLPWFSPPEGTGNPGPRSSDQKAKETPEPTGKAHCPVSL